MWPGAAEFYINASQEFVCRQSIYSVCGYWLNVTARTSEVPFLRSASMAGADKFDVHWEKVPIQTEAVDKCHTNFSQVRPSIGGVKHPPNNDDEPFSQKTLSR